MPRSHLATPRHENSRLPRTEGERGVQGSSRPRALSTRAAVATGAGAKYSKHYDNREPESVGSKRLGTVIITIAVTVSDHLLVDNVPTAILLWRALTVVERSACYETTVSRVASTAVTTPYGLRMARPH